MPSATPSASHHRASRCHESRVTAKSAAVQAAWSSTTGWNRLAERRKSGLASTATAANTCARRPAAELAREERRGQEERGAHDGRHRSDGEQGVAEERAGRFGYGRDARWEVHPPELEVPAHGEVEQFVPVEAVRGRRVHPEVQRELDGRQRQDASRRRTTAGISVPER